MTQIQYKHPTLGLHATCGGFPPSYTIYNIPHDKMLFLGNENYWLVSEKDLLALWFEPIEPVQETEQEKSYDVEEHRAYVESGMPKGQPIGKDTSVEKLIKKYDEVIAKYDKIISIKNATIAKLEMMVEGKSIDTPTPPSQDYKPYEKQITHCSQQIVKMIRKRESEDNLRWGSITDEIIDMIETFVFLWEKTERDWATPTESIVPQDTDIDSLFEKIDDMIYEYRDGSYENGKKLLSEVKETIRENMPSA